MGRRKDSLNSGTALKSPQQTDSPLVAAALLGEQILLPHPSLRPLKQLLMSCNDVEDSVPLSSTSEAAPYELCDVEDSDPVSSTSEAAPYELCDVEDSDPSLHW